MKNGFGNRPRARDLGIVVGVLPPGAHNAITDVPGVRVGHCTLIQGHGNLMPGQGPIRTGVTAILPHPGDLFLEKITGAIVRINGFGEVTNSQQVDEMGVMEGPILLTNTMNVPRVADAVIDWAYEHSSDMSVTTWGISPIVAETSDNYLNDARGRHVRREHVFEAIASARDGIVTEGAVGGGTGMICYEFKGGIGTASRVLAAEFGGYTVGALVQSNFGSRAKLRIDGVPVGRALMDYDERIQRDSQGSVIVVIATDAPMSSRQLKRMGMRVAFGLARTGTQGGNTSGDFAICFSTARNRPHHSTAPTLQLTQVVEDTALINQLFDAVVETTEEAVLNSLFKAETMQGRDHHIIYALPIQETVEIMNRYGHTQVKAPSAESS
ncbi:MAG: Beta-peptidyl aminopeptidase BapA [Anaerolineae bacterium]|nr:Beta-peptidyl aminopeptidase BapA [Anaerolineae bacterium]